MLSMSLQRTFDIIFRKRLPTTPRPFDSLLTRELRGLFEYALSIMKIRKKWVWGIVSLLAAGGICIFGAICILIAPSVREMLASHINPVAGWQTESGEPDQAIQKDYQEYLTKPLVDKHGFVSVADWLKDGHGQHAIVIEEGRYDTYWHHVLIYDKNDKRIKVITYVGGHYQS